MTQFRFTRVLSRLVVVLALALLVTPTAYAGGGAVSHHYAPAPLDAGSAVPNPDYLPATAPQLRPDNQANRALVHGRQQAVVLASRTSANDFDWGDAGLGAAGTLAVLLVAMGSGLVLRDRRRRLASA
jgi:hypothetical protein